MGVLRGVLEGGIGAVCGPFCTLYRTTKVHSQFGDLACLLAPTLRAVMHFVLELKGQVGSEADAGKNATALFHFYPTYPLA